MYRYVLAVIICLFYVQAQADIIVVEKQNGVEQKILISGDKVQVRKRMDSGTVSAGLGSKMAEARGILGSRRSVEEAQDKYAKSKGIDEVDRDAISRKRISQVDDELQKLEREKAANNGKLSSSKQARYDELKQKKKDLETLTEDGETVYDKKQREKNLKNISDMEGQKETLTAETVDKSLMIETYRFDQGRYYIVKPSKGSYEERTIDEERAKRGKGSGKSSSAHSAGAEVKATGETEMIDGVKCKVYQGTLEMRGRALASDRLCIAPVSAAVAREYWNGQNRVLLEVGSANPNPVERYFIALARSYFDELAKLPGIPLKRTMSLGRATPDGSGTTVVETKIVSTEAIGPEQFELPKGLKKQ